MMQIVKLILDQPIGFFLVCCGIGVVLRAAGAQQALPTLLRFFALVIQRVWEEFTKGRGERTAIELIDFILIVFFGSITFLATICLLLPSGLAQAIGFAAQPQEIGLRYFYLSIVMFCATGIGSGTLVLVADKDSAVRSLLNRLLGSTHEQQDEEQPPTT